MEGFKHEKPAAKAFSAVVSESSRIAELLLENAQLKAALEVRHKKRYLDSGANVRIIADIVHLDPHTSPSFCRAEEPCGFETANQALMPVEGEGQIIDVTGKLRSEAGASLVSKSQVLCEHDSSLVIDNFGAKVFKNSVGSIVIVNKLNNHVTSTHTLIFNVPLNTDSMYESTQPFTPTVDPHTYALVTPSSLTSGALETSDGVLAESAGERLDIAATEAGDTADWGPSERVLKQH